MTIIIKVGYILKNGNPLNIFYHQYVFCCCNKDGRYFMAGLYLVALRAMHAALPSSLLDILTFDVDSWTPSNLKRPPVSKF